MSVDEIAVGLALGGLAAWIHLAVTRWRIAALARRSTGPVLATLPLGVGVPALCLFVALQRSPSAFWSPLAGFWILHTLALARVAWRSGTARP